MKTPHVEVKLVAEDISVQPGQSLTLGLHMKIIPGWHTYWKNPGDSGEPFKVKWNAAPPANFGPLLFPYPKKIEMPPLANYGYEGEVMFLNSVHVPKELKPGDHWPVQAHATWLVCEETCIPESADLEISLSVTSQAPQKNLPWAEAFAETRGRIPQSFNSGKIRLSEEGDYLWIHLPRHLRTYGKNLNFFPEESGQIENAAETLWEETPEGPALRLRKSHILTQMPQELSGVLVVASPQAIKGMDQAWQITARANQDFGQAKFILFAFLGGLLLNLMPCVFPVLSIKVLSFLKKSGESKAKVQMHGLTYALGVLVSFWILAGVLILIKLGGQQVGWGFQLQSPLFILLLAYLMFLLGLSLLGLFEIGTSFLGLGHRLTTGSGFLPTFFTGVLATVVATPCVAPFMGPALGIALTKTNLMSAAIFTVLGMGMAFPYLALSFFPAAIRWLPKPGPWMETFKQAMAFLLFATVLWLFWVFSLQTDLDSSLAFLIGLLLLAFGVWMGSRLKRGQGWHHYVALAIAILIVLGGFGFGIIHIQHRGADFSSTPGKNATGVAWEPYSEEELTKLRSQGKAVFLNFTAAWCITCQVNERLVFQKEEIRKAFAEQNITALKADWTQRDANIARTLARYGRQGVPLYVLYGPGPNAKPILLPQILTPSMVIKEIKKNLN